MRDVIDLWLTRYSSLDSACGTNHWFVRAVLVCDKVALVNRGQDGIGLLLGVEGSGVYLVLICESLDQGFLAHVKG